jgi:hypothetical protein
MSFMSTGAVEVLVVSALQLAEEALAVADSEFFEPTSVVPQAASRAAMVVTAAAVMARRARRCSRMRFLQG